MNRLRAIGIGLTFLLAFDTLAQICFKLVGNHVGEFRADAGWILGIFGSGALYGAIAGYLGAFFTWIFLLKKAPVGPAFAASHLDVLSVLALSAWLFHEPIRLSHVVGCALIVAGIVLLAVSEAKES